MENQNQKTGYDVRLIFKKHLEEYYELKNKVNDFDETDEEEIRSKLGLESKFDRDVLSPDTIQSENNAIVKYKIFSELEKDCDLISNYKTFSDLENVLVINEAFLNGKNQIYLLTKDFLVFVEDIYEKANPKCMLEIVEEINNNLKEFDKLIPSLEKECYSCFSYCIKNNMKSDRLFIFEDLHEENSPISDKAKLLEFKETFEISKEKFEAISQDYTEIYEASKLIVPECAQFDKSEYYDGINFYITGNSLIELAENVLKVDKAIQKLKDLTEKSNKKTEMLIVDNLEVDKNE